MAMKNLDYVFLLDCYGEMLTQNQRNIAELYYNEDFSLSEIAEMQHITRQAVWDSLRHAETSLLEMEQKLGMAEKVRRIRSCLEQILTVCETGQVAALAEQALHLL